VTFQEAQRWVIRVSGWKLTKVVLSSAAIVTGGSSCRVDRPIVTEQ
jgi:hypothetical protein